jgi:ATP-dependent Clp endopeptidase proteolytic subunit ClpP
MNISTLNDWRAWAKSFPQRADANTPEYKSPFRVVNKTATEAEILIYDQIGRDFWSGEGVAAQDFAKLMADVDPNATLTIGVNSPGGSVHDGLAIYNTLLAHKGKVITRNDGMAASIASIILQAGKERISNAAALVMIHRAWGMLIGNADDAAAFKSELEKHDKVLAEIYSAKTGKSMAEIEKAMSDETFFTGNEALAFGLVDKVLSTTSNAQNTLAAHVAKPDNQTIVAGIKNKIGDKQMNDTAQTPAATQSQPVNFDPVIQAINALGDKLDRNTKPALGTEPVASIGTAQVLGNPMVEKYNGFFEPDKKAAFAKANYGELRKQLLIAAGVKDFNINDRWDFTRSTIVAANTVDSALANTVLSNEFVTTMRTYIAPWSAFTRTVALSPVSRRQVLEVPLYSSSGSKQQNATNYETGDSTLAPVAVTVAEESKSFHVSRPEQNLGLQLAGLIPTNTKVLAEGIHAKMTALMTSGNFGSGTVVGAAANFDSADLPAILALGKNFDSVRLVLDGGHLAYLLPTNTYAFKFGEPGAFGFDGGIYKSNLWTGAITNTVGFVCGPDAIVNAWGQAENLPAGEALSTTTVDVNGIPFSLTVWFSRASRAVWASIQVMHGCAVGDATQGKVLISA